jgi:MFS transporter, CP family, cyanate transporter
LDIGVERTRSAPVLAALIFLVALNLRPSLTAVGPLLPQIGDQLRLGEGAQGLLGALPLLAFGVTSPVVHRISRRLGTERAVLVALVVLAAGIVIRSYAGAGGLWVGTLMLGCGIAVGNVLVPAIVKRDYSNHVSRATSIYSACISLGASVASVIAVPLSNGAGWRGSLAFWAVPALVAALCWVARTRGAAPDVTPDDDAVDTPPVSVWRQPMAWLVTAFMGLQSTFFYVLVTWLPTIESSDGSSAAQAGAHLFVFQLVGIASGLAIPRLMRRPHNQTVAAATASVAMLVGALGLLAAPGWDVVWVVIGGLGSGAALVVALTLISLRGRTHHETTQLSGMAQSLGYLFAAAGPVAAGLLAEYTGNRRAPLIMVVVLATIQLVVAFLVGRDRIPEASGE